MVSAGNHHIILILKIERIDMNHKKLTRFTVRRSCKLSKVEEINGP